MLEKLILERCGTKAIFAKMMGIRRQNINHIQNPTAKRLWDMVRILDLTEEELYQIVKEFAER